MQKNVKLDKNVENVVMDENIVKQLNYSVNGNFENNTIYDDNGTPFISYNIETNKREVIKTKD